MTAPKFSSTVPTANSSANGYEQINDIYIKLQAMATASVLQPLNLDEGDVGNLANGVMEKVIAFCREHNIDPLFHDWFVRSLFNQMVSDLMSDLQSKDSLLFNTYNVSYLLDTVQSKLNVLSAILEKDQELPLSNSNADDFMFSGLAIHTETGKIQNRLADVQTRMYEYLLSTEFAKEGNAEPCFKIASLFFTPHEMTRKMLEYVQTRAKSYFDSLPFDEINVSSEKLERSVEKLKFNTLKNVMWSAFHAIVQAYQQSVIRCFDYVVGMDEEQYDNFVQKFVPSENKMFAIADDYLKQAQESKHVHCF